MSSIELKVGERAVLEAPEKSASGTWGIAGDAVSFRTPATGRASVEIVGVHAGAAVVSFHPHHALASGEDVYPVTVLAQPAESDEAPAGTVEEKPKKGAAKKGARKGRKKAKT